MAVKFSQIQNKVIRSYTKLQVEVAFLWYCSLGMCHQCTTLLSASFPKTRSPIHWSISRQQVAILYLQITWYNFVENKGYISLYLICNFFVPSFQKISRHLKIKWDFYSTVEYTANIYTYKHSQSALLGNEITTGRLHSILYA